MKRFILFVFAVLCVGSLYAARTDKFYSENPAGAKFRITADEVITQTGTSGATNALGPTSVTGAFSASGVTTLTGGSSVPGTLTSAGKRITTPTNYTIGGGTTVTPTSEFGLFVTTGTGAIDWTATPSIATTTATEGQVFEIMSSTTTDITINDNGSVSGTLIELASGSTSRVLSNPGDVIRFRYYSGKWYETSTTLH